jgi:hypothetical protein
LCCCKAAKRKKPQRSFAANKLQYQGTGKEETMKNTGPSRITRFGMIAVLVVTALLTAAHAQSLPPAPQTAKLDNLHTGNGAGLSADDGIRPPSSSVGWYYVHPKNCKLFYSGGYPYLYVYTVEGYYFYTTSSAFQAVIDPACQTGNWLAFYVYDGNYDWSEIYTYTYK